MGMVQNPQIRTGRELVIFVNGKRTRIFPVVIGGK